MKPADKKKQKGLFRPFCFSRRWVFRDVSVRLFERRKRFVGGEAELFTENRIERLGHNRLPRGVRVHLVVQQQSRDGVFPPLGGDLIPPVEDIEQHHPRFTGHLTDHLVVSAQRNVGERKRIVRVIRGFPIVAKGLFAPAQLAGRHEEDGDRFGLELGDHPF